VAEWPEPSVPRVLLVALALVMVVVVAQGANSSAAAFSASNSGWEGSSDLGSLASGEGADARVAAETSAYRSVAPSETVAFVVSPDSDYGSEGVLDAATFVRNGGTLVVAAEGPRPANSLLAGVGASARVGETPLYDVRENFRTSAMPLAGNVSDHPLVSGVESLTLNHGTVVKPGEARVLVNTSEYAYLDENRNGQYDDAEELTNRPVATVEGVGAGRVVVVSDASVFINSMLDRRGNRRFVRSLVAGKSTVLLDHSHKTGLALLPRTVLFLRNSGLFQFAVGTLALGAVAVWVRRPEFPRSVETPWSGTLPWKDDELHETDGDEGDLAAELAARHPDHDRETAERVADRIDRSGGE
jgi:hypothetical protein